MQKYFFLFVLSLLSLLPHQAFAATSEASVSVVPALTQLSVDEQDQLLFTFSLKNDHPQSIDVRSISFGNLGNLSLESVFSDISLVDNQGKEISTRVRFFEDWHVGKKELLSSVVQIQVESQEIETGDSEEYKLRAMVKGGVSGGTVQFVTEAVSVLVPGTTFSRDLSLDASDVGQALTFESAAGLVYNPNIVSLKDSELKPDLVIEEVYFAKEYGYQKDLIVAPVCNKGNGPTALGDRIEGTIYTKENYLRDFIIRKPLAAGKCFEQVFSAKRDLRINKAASHSVRVQLDPQNIIDEERENNNERQDLVIIKDKSVNTNTEFISDQPLSLRQRILARMGLIRSRPNAAKVNLKTSNNRRSSSREIIRPRSKSTKVDNDTYLVHPNYGEESKYLGTKITQDEFAPVENNIIREELPESAEDIWNETRWERQSASRKIRFDRRRLEEKEAPTSIEENKRKPTFRKPNAINRYRTSYRGLRSGIRTETDFRGGRVNNDPVTSHQRDLSAFCEDSDGLNIYERGIVRYKSRKNASSRTVSDVTRGNYILEYHCDGKNLRRQLFECEEGKVEDGFCKQ